MIYAMSDLHGEREKFRKMLELISFSDDDELYILGDVVDRGPDPAGLLQDLCVMPNAYCIMGNHELMAIQILRILLEEISESNYDTRITAQVMKNMLEWQVDGGTSTIESFRRLSNDRRMDLLDFMEDFSPYEVVDAGGKSFILVHSGLGNYSPDKALEDYTPEELVQIRPNFGEDIFGDRDLRIVCGHTPTLALNGKAEIYHEKSYIDIDCGACFEGGRLACLRLDDMSEFYV